MPYRPKIAIIGAGTWGKNLIREFNQISDIVSICFRGNEETQKILSKTYPQIKTTSSFNEAISDAEAVVIATPIETHVELVRNALGAGKHVFVEKPLTLSKEEAEELYTLAEEKQKVLFVGYIFLYTTIFEKLQELTQEDRIVKAHFTWKKMGTFGEPLTSNLLSHELSIAITLLGKPTGIETVFTHAHETSNDHAEYKLLYPQIECLIMIDRHNEKKEKSIELTTQSGAVYLWQQNNLFKNGEVILTDTPPLIRECTHFIESMAGSISPKTNKALDVAIAELLSNLN